MKYLVKKSRADELQLQTIEQAFAQIEALQIASCNWPAEYPYAPSVQARLFHNGAYLFIRYDVSEKYTAALAAEDMGNVWEDSCCEFFISLGDGTYYNFESTCIGTLLMTNRKSRNEDVCPASIAVLDSVLRWPSLGRNPFTEISGDNNWSLILAIPATALFKQQLTSWDGVKAKANLYKCGDKLSEPHFLSWNPIALPSPDFHCPAFFADLEFEK